MNTNNSNQNYNRQQTPTKHHPTKHFQRNQQHSKQKQKITTESFENEVKKEMSEINDLQKGLIDDITKTTEEVKQMRERNEMKSKEIKRNIIVQNEYNEFITIMETETERYLSTYQTTIQERLQELNYLEHITSSIKLINKDELTNRIVSMEHSLPQIEKETKEKLSLIKTLEEYQHAMIRTLEKLQKQTDDEIEKEKKEEHLSKYKNYAADIETILYLENGELLLSYLQTINIDDFCEIEFTQPVLLSLISNIVSNLSTEFIEVRLSYLLLSLKLLQRTAIHYRYIELFQNIQKTFISFSMLINHENCYKSILTILFMCEDIIRTLESMKVNDQSNNTETIESSSN